MKAGIGSARILVCFLALCPIAGGASAPQTQPRLPFDPNGKTASVTECQTCHINVTRPFQASVHWKIDLAKHSLQACEACHGPAGKHVEGGGDPAAILSFKTLAPAKVADLCLSCHQYTEEHGNFRRSAHKLSQVSCLDCHSIHHQAEKQYLLVKAQPQLCYTCHAETKAAFLKPFHHRVNEGLVKCTDCHNQHGGFLNKKLRTAEAQQQTCARCHQDQVGPFTFEHGPLQTEGCGACHVPHGSSNPRMLKRVQVNQLCLECHTFTPGLSAQGVQAFHNQAERYQACTLCHVAIHGSNFNKAFLK